jgi:Predicted transcriptional regulators
MKELLQSLKSKKYVGVAELAEQAAAILENSNTYQEKGTVTEYPDERTIRYYISESLIPPSTEKHGTASVFGYEHLLALLAVKKLQAQYLPIRKIREILVGKSVSELEKLLGTEAEQNSAKNEAQKYLESLLLAHGRKTEETDEPRLILANLSRPKAPKPQAKTGQSWTRFEIEKGLELHIEKNYKASSDFKARRALIKEIEEIIHSFRDKK